MKLRLDTDMFLADYWQQKPLLIRNAIQGFTPPVDANELAGLAMEDEVESRIIETLADNWALHHGPFDAADFERDKPWTLLVQAVDHYVQEVAGLLALVDFIPSWRVDDVMVSYAVDGGSVGPHYDNYDVFLLQGQGKRHWQLGQLCDSSTALLPHAELRILDTFNCTEAYTLEPGDLLYIPPGVAHWGIAQGECTTFSLGFRAPRINDMLSRRADELLETIDPEAFYSDGGQSAARLSGEIRAEDIARANAQLVAVLDKKIGQHWFGELVTEPRYALELDDAAIECQRETLRAADATVLLLPSAKLAWQQDDKGITIFANGESLQFSQAIRPGIIHLCKDGTLAGAALMQLKTVPEGFALLEQLLDLACISIE